MFGSVGPFESLYSMPRRAPRTLLLANPPFLATSMNGLTPKLMKLLTKAGAEKAVALCVVPSVGSRENSDVPYIDALRNCPLTRGERQLEAGEHAFCSGIAHRQTFNAHVGHTSRHATSLFVMTADDSVDVESAGRLLDAVTVAFKSVSITTRTNT